MEMCGGTGKYQRARPGHACENPDLISCWNLIAPQRWTALTVLPTVLRRNEQQRRGPDPDDHGHGRKKTPTGEPPKKKKVSGFKNPGVPMNYPSTNPLNLEELLAQGEGSCFAAAASRARLSTKPTRNPQALVLSPWCVSRI